MVFNILLFELLLITYITIILSTGMSRNRIEQKLKRIEFYLDLMLDRLEIDRFPESIKEIALDPNPRRRLEAVRLYRKQTGASLQEAIKAIETLSGRKFKP